MLKKHKVIVITSAVLAATLCIGTAIFMADNQAEEIPAETSASESIEQEVVAPLEAELPAVESIHAESLALVLNGEASANLNATVETDTLPDGAQIIFDYAASNESITVDENGTVTAQSVSAVVPFVSIMAKYDADGDGVADSNTVLASQKVQVSVKLVAESIELSMVSVMIYVFPYMGIESDMLQLVTTVLPEGATTTYTYSSSDESIATVTDGGIISAIAEGTATITATSEDGLAAVCEVTVSRAPADVSAQEEAEAAAQAAADAAAQAAAEAAAAQAAAEVAAAQAAEAAATQAATTQTTATQANYASIDCAAIETAIYNQLNALRTASGLAALSYNGSLATVADLRANEIMSSYSHTRPDGSKYYTAYNACGYTGYSFAGENITRVTAINYSADADSIATAIYQSWYNSSTHLANMLDGDFTQVGIGVIYNAAEGKFYAVQNFS